MSLPQTCFVTTTTMPLLVSLLISSLPSAFASPTSVDCSATWDQQAVSVGTQGKVYACPPDCIRNATSTDAAYGDVIYHWNSSLCLAAIHAGAISNDAGGNFYLSALNGVGSYKSVERNGVTSKIHAGNPGGFQEAFLTQPYMVEETSVTAQGETNSISVTKWDQINGTYDHSFDSYDVFFQLASVSDVDLTTLAPVCNIPKNEQQKCDINNGVDAGTIYNVYIATSKTSYGLKFLSAASPTRVMTKPESVSDINFSDVTSSSFTVTFAWNPSSTAVQTAAFIGRINGVDTPTTNSTPVLVFEGLEAGTIYDVGVKVQIRDNVTDKIQFDSATGSRLQITKPNTPLWKKWDSDKAGEITLEWEAAGKKDEIVLSYQEDGVGGIWQV